jgi:hypothetical protein
MLVVRVRGSALDAYHHLGKYQGFVARCCARITLGESCVCTYMMIAPRIGTKELPRPLRHTLLCLGGPPGPPPDTSWIHSACPISWPRLLLAGFIHAGLLQPEVRSHPAPGFSRVMASQPLPDPQAGPVASMCRPSQAACQSHSSWPRER